MRVSLSLVTESIRLDGLSMSDHGPAQRREGIPAILSRSSGLVSQPATDAVQKFVDGVVNSTTEDEIDFVATA